MVYVYILYSGKLDKYYIGQTSNLEDRLFRHNNSGSQSTKGGKDWVIKYTEGYNTVSEAVRRETEIKKKKSRKYLEWLIRAAG
ncbi:MAG: GIY-YIG nuclease family protein [Flavobacteriales bacterium]|nr:GIY-YIG nuclease family protein [Flavobacteriales bacterium]